MLHEVGHLLGSDIGQMQTIRGRIGTPQHICEAMLRDQEHAISRGEPALSNAVADLVWKQRKFEHHEKPARRGQSRQ